MCKSELIAQWKTKFPKISDLTHEVTQLNLIGLEEQNYLECHQVYRKNSNQQAKMLEEMLLYFDETFIDRTCINILSVGCGMGIFEVPFLNQLLSLQKHIHFVGIDPNQAECLEIQKKLESLAREHQNFSFEIFNEDFDSFSFPSSFDMILCVHVLYYVENSHLESTLLKLAGFLESDGKLIIISTPVQAFNVPFLCITNHQGSHPCYNHNIELIFESFKIPFERKPISASIDISDCFEQSKQGEQLLNFTLGVHTEYFSASQKQFFLDYLYEIGQTNPNEKIVCPYNFEMFYVGKWD